MGNCNTNNLTEENKHNEMITAQPDSAAPKDDKVIKARGKAAKAAGHEEGTIVNDLEIIVEEEATQRKVETELDLLKKQIEQNGYLSNKETMDAKTCEIITQIEEREKLSDLVQEWKQSLNTSDLLYPGVVQFFDGSFYDGYWNKEFKKNGIGSMLMQNGSKYVGNFIDDRIEGKGYFIDIEGKLYIGDFQNSMAHGKGKIISEKDPGYSYEGDFYENLFHGEGKEIFSNGTIYQGNFVRGEKGPKGKMIFADGGEYEGDIVNGNCEGYGTFKWKNGKVYTGTFSANKLNGKGKTTWVDGSYYDGEYKNDQFNGIGEYRQSDGSIFKGKFINNYIHGVGYFKDETIEYKGLWRYNKNIMKFD